MIEKLLHTPEGVRDIYDRECKTKNSIESRLGHVMELFGYQEIETPTFEFFDVFNHETGTVSSREMYKFFDRNNDTLVLRPDMTPSIARSVAKYYSDCDYPLRFSYKGNTFLNLASYQGKLNEKTEMGAELVNDDSPEADAEGIIMMIEGFLAAGLSEFRIDIGQVDFYKGLMDALDVSDEIKHRIHEYIENKNALAMDSLLAGLEIQPCYREVLMAYNDLFGDATMLVRARELTVNERCRAAVERLEQVYEVLKIYGYEKYVSFDLGMVNHHDYYTGIIFRGYTYGTGDAIGKGGRYDNLYAQFGKNSPAIGFTILVDDLLIALSRQNIRVSLKEYSYGVLLYEKEENADAISLAMDLRKGGVKIQLTSRQEDHSVEDYISFVKGQGADRLLYLCKGEVVCYDFAGDSKTTQILQDFREEY